MPAAPLGKSTLFGCPISGEVAPVSQCPDPTFAQEILGPGVVIFPEGCELFAPADALGLGTAEGVKFLIHVGMDTNKLEGDGFQSFAKMGDEVKRGDKLLSFDPQVMAENRCSLATPFVFCNSKEGWDLEILRTGRVEAGEDLIRLTPKET